MQLKGKIIIKGTLTTLTGLHIGGEKSSLAIGGIDNSVIKTAKGKGSADGVPYIPGSSLKGKLRSLLAQKEGSLFFSKKEQEKIVGKAKNDATKKQLNEAPTDEAYEYIMDLFGYSGDNDDKNERIGHTQLLVRDAFWTKANQEEWLSLTHSKMENVINRRTGTAEHPREIERVPVGAEFAFELVYNIYETAKLATHLKHLELALKLLEDDYIGGLGSRGYGQVKVNIEPTDIVLKEIRNDQYVVSDDWTLDGDKHEALENFKNNLIQI